MARKTSDHLRLYLSVFEAEYPLQKGYIARLLVVDKRSVTDVFREVRSIVQAAEPDRHFNEGTLLTQLYDFQKLIFIQIDLTRHWQSLVKFFLQPFPITFSSLPVRADFPQPQHKPYLHHGQSMELTKTSVLRTSSTRNTGTDLSVVAEIICDHNYDAHSEVKQEKIEYDENGEADTLEDISLATDLNKIDNYVSSNSSCYYSHTCADVEDNRTVVHNSHSSVCSRENVLSDRISSEDIKEEMCYTDEHSETEVKQEKTEYDEDGEADTMEDISLSSDLNKIDNYVSSNSPSHNSHTCADVEENRTAENNSHNSVCVRENVFSDRKSNHHVLTSEDIKEEMCYTEDVKSGEDKNKQTQKDATESVIVIDFQAMVAGVKDGRNENRDDLLQEHNNKLLEQGLSDCEKTLQCPQKGVNIAICSQKYVDKMHVNKWKTNSVACQAPSQLPVLECVKPASGLKTVYPCVLLSHKPSVLHNNQSTVLQSYKCKICHHEYLLNSSLKEHTLVQNGILPHICSNCGNAFRLDTIRMEQTNEQTEKMADKSAQFDNKLSVLHNNQLKVLQSDQSSVVQPSVLQSYKCKFCHHGFLLNCSLKEHEQVQRGVLPYKCSNCALDTVLIKKTDNSAQYDDTFYIGGFSGGTFQRRIFMQKYRMKHTEKQSYKCDICGCEFAANFHLKKHQKTHTGEEPYKCDVCGREYATKRRLSIHKRMHREKKHKCDVCGRGFPVKNNLNVHKLKHTDEKPHQCDTCGLTFKYRITFNKHRRTHGDGNPFKCDVCGHEYRSKYDLSLHTRMHTGENLCKCDFCGKVFTHNSQLRKHKRMHTGEKPCKCDICGKSFIQNSTLKVHTRVHTKERPYKCDVCGAGFVSSTSLKKHKITHTGEKPYECDICGFRVNRKDSLRSHKKVHKA